jgi:hypothetical protein
MMYMAKRAQIAVISQNYVRYGVYETGVGLKIR